MDQNEKIQELIHKLDESDDSEFPEWLFSPNFNEFEGDETYWLEYDESDPDLHDILTNRKAERNFNEWQSTMQAYTRYMNKLVKKYGSINMVLHGSEVGFVPEFIPNEPKLKPTKENKTIMRTGYIPSQQNLSREQMTRSTNFMIEMMNERCNIADVVNEMNDAEIMIGNANQEHVDKMARERIAKDRQVRFLHGVHHRGDHNPPLQVAAQVYSSNSLAYATDVPDTGDEINPIQALRELEEFEAKSEIDLAIKERNVKKSFISYDKDRDERSEIIEALQKGGFDYKDFIGAKTVGTHSVSLTSGADNQTLEDLKRSGASKKEIKKFKKKQKKAMREQEKRTRVHIKREQSMARLISMNQLAKSNGATFGSSLSADIDAALRRK